MQRLETYYHPGVVFTHLAIKARRIARFAQHALPRCSHAPRCLLHAALRTACRRGVPRAGVHAGCAVRVAEQARFRCALRVRLRC
jgi:hypothetical protein